MGTDMTLKITFQETPTLSDLRPGDHPRLGLTAQGLGRHLQDLGGFLEGQRFHGLGS